MRNNNRGLTLIELIVCMGISGIVLAMIVSYLLFNTKIYTKANYEANLQYDCTEIMEKVTVAAKESYEIIKEPDPADPDPPDPDIAEYFFINEDEAPINHSDYPASSYPDDTFVIIKFEEDAHTLSIYSGTGKYEYKFAKNFEVTAPSGETSSLREIFLVGEMGNEVKYFRTTVSMRNS